MTLMPPISTNIKLHSLENMVQSALYNLPVAIYTCDSSGYITSFNKAAETLWGRSPELGKDLWYSFWKTLKPNGEVMLLEDYPMARTLKLGVAIEGEEIMVERLDSTRINVLAYPVPLYEDGVLVGAVNTLIDITSQKQGESKEAMLASIIESSDDAIISKTLEGKITTWNQAAEQMYGYTESEVLGKHISIIIPHDRLSEEDIIISKIKSGEKVDHFETWRVDKFGKQIPVSLTISPIRNNKGQITGASKTARDITRYKADEFKLQQYAENLETLNEVGKYISESLDVDEILQIVTNATTKLTGAAFGAFFYNKVDDNGESYMLYTLSGAPKDAFEKFGMPRNTEVFSRTFSGEGIFRSDDITKDPRYGKNAPHYGMPKGHLPVVSYLAVPVISKDGNVLGGLFYGHPEPGRFSKEHEQLVSGVVLQAAAALENANLYEEIKRLNAKKDEFIGMASHELRTPITSLKGYLQIFERGLPENDLNKTYINKAVQQVNKLSQLISDLLDVSKIETGKLPLVFSDFDLKHLLIEVIELMQYSSRLHHISFHTELNEIVVTADRQRIEQVIINLITNAIKYSPAADKINISLSKKDSNAHVEIQDYGIGLTHEQQPRVFSRFYRVDELASHISGLGIGLYISKEIITRHNGQLNVISEPEKGSTFYFDIPLQAS